MEIGLKERLIGAVVLVILAVIIIPWVLEGGSPSSTSVTKPLTLPPAAATTAPSTYRMDLNTSASPAQSEASSTLPARITPAPVQVTRSPNRTPMRPAPMVKSIVAKPVKTASQTPTRGAWAVQAGSYSDKGNAQGVVHKLAQHGYHAYISRFRNAGRTYYRVRVGPYADHAAAQHAALEIGRVYGGRAEAVPKG